MKLYCPSLDINLIGDAAVAVRPSETGFSADLGGSSKYSNENFED